MQAALHRRGGHRAPLGPGLLRPLLRARRWRHMMLKRFLNNNNDIFIIIYFYNRGLLRHLLRARRWRQHMMIF